MLQQVPADVCRLLQEQLPPVSLRSRLRFADLFDGMRELDIALSNGVSITQRVDADLRFHLVQGSAARGGTDTRSYVVEGAA